MLKKKKGSRNREKRKVAAKAEKGRKVLKQKEREGWNKEFFSIYFLSNLLRKNYGELVCVGFNF